MSDSERKVIPVSKENWEALKKLKVHPRQPFDEVISKLLEAYDIVHAQASVPAGEPQT